jgi:hypothetical protein
MEPTLRPELTQRQSQNQGRKVEKQTCLGLETKLLELVGKWVDWSCRQHPSLESTPIHSAL